MQPHRIRTLLEDSVPELPPATIDLVQAVDQGRTIIRRRRAGMAAVAGGVLAVVAIAPLAFGAVTDGRAGRPAPGGVGSSTAPASGPPVAPAPGQAPERFDPLVRTMQPGWLPGQLTATWWGITGRTQQLQAHERGGTDTDGLLVEFWARGEKIPARRGYGMPAEPVQRSTAPVRGRPATCLATKGVAGSCSALRWQYAADGWAQVSYAGPSGTTPAKAASVVRRIAESVTLTANVPVRVPLRLTGQAAGLRVFRTQVVEPPGSAERPWSVHVALSDDGAPRAENSPDCPGVVIEVDGEAGELKRAVPDTTVDGHPAWRSKDEPNTSDELIALSRDRDIRISVRVVQRPWDAVRLFRDVRLVARPADPGTWVRLP